MGRGTRAGKGIAKANGKATGRKAMKNVSNDTAITKAMSKSSSSSAPVGSAVSRRPAPIVEMIEVLDRNSKNCDGSLHDFMEFYSPPQIAPKCRALGLNVEHSLDNTTSGHDFSQHSDRVRGFKLINELAPMLVMMSPPCTMFSELQRLWNLNRMNDSVYENRMKEAKCHIHYAMQIAKMQHAVVRFFGFEQPGRASSWDLECVKSVAALPGVTHISFDMCMFAKVSPHNKNPIKKRTVIMTNTHELAAALRGKCCDGSHLHTVCAGSEGGVKLSTWCQVYPPQLCNAIANTALATSR